MKFLGKLSENKTSSDWRRNTQDEKHNNSSDTNYGKS